MFICVHYLFPWLLGELNWLDLNWPRILFSDLFLLYTSMHYTSKQILCFRKSKLSFQEMNLHASSECFPACSDVHCVEAVLWLLKHDNLVRERAAPHQPTPVLNRGNCSDTLLLGWASYHERFMCWPTWCRAIWAETEICHMFSSEVSVCAVQPGSSYYELIISGSRTEAMDLKLWITMLNYQFGLTVKNYSLCR